MYRPRLDIDELACSVVSIILGWIQKEASFTKRWVEFFMHNLKGLEHRVLGWKLLNILNYNLHLSLGQEMLCLISDS